MILTQVQSSWELNWTQNTADKAPPSPKLPMQHEWTDGAHICGVCIQQKKKAKDTESGKIDNIVHQIL